MIYFILISLIKQHIPTFKVDVGSQGPNSAVKIKEFINPENGKDLEGKKDE